MTDYGARVCGPSGSLYSDENIRIQSIGMCMADGRVNAAISDILASCSFNKLDSSRANL